MTEPWPELNEQQRHQFLNAEMVFHEYERARADSRQHRGSMFWREQDGRSYLIQMSAGSRQKSLGPRSAETEAMHERFNRRKVGVEDRLRKLESELESHQRLNKALRLGRAPNVLVAILDSLAQVGVDDHFLVVGTNALYAYEMAAGVRFPNDAMATMDAYLLFDTRRTAEFLEVMRDRDKSFVDLLRKADSSFERVDAEVSKAVNDRGDEVELLRGLAPPKGAPAERLTDAEIDLWPLQASTGERLLSAPRFSQIVVSLNGAMARMHTVHPVAFARVKKQLAGKTGRDPLKAPKDALQAKLVMQLVASHLPHLKQAEQEAPLPASRSSRSSRA